MTIEPINSAMTYQAQQVVKPTPAPAPAENMEVPQDGQNVNIDETTAVVGQSQAADDNGNGSQNQQQPTMTSQSSNEQLKKAVAEMNRKINNTNEEAVFGIHEETNRVTIKIVDKDTKEVIKELPPEKTLDMIAKLWEVAGILVDEKR